MRIEILEPESETWRQVLQGVRHDVYHFPEYVALEGRRIQAKPEAIWIQAGEAQFFLPYLVRDCAEVFGDFLAPGEVYDAVSPYGYPGMLWNEAAKANPTFGQTVLDSLQQNFCDRKICSIFIRNHPILNTSFPEEFENHGLVFAGNTVSMDLTVTEGQLWSHTRRGHQSTINKCKRLGYIGEWVDPQTNLDNFLDVYFDTMDRVDARSDYYFNEVYFSDLLSLGDALHLVVVKLEDQIVSVSFLFEANGIVQGHLGGTKTAYLQDSPFSLLQDYVRHWAWERGNQYYHIGGGVGAAEDALFRFKSGFSKKRHEFWIMKFITASDLYLDLVKLKEKKLGYCLETSFFPAYRSGS